MTAFTGTAGLVRLILRRDRWRLPLWLLGIAALVWFSAASIKATYNTPQAIASYAATAGDAAAGLLMNGNQAAVDTLAGIVANETTIITNLGVTLMVLFLVVRHTRAEEETGRAELLRAGVLGRHASALAALLVAVAASLVVGALITLVLLASGLGMPGSIAYGAENALLAVFFAAVAAVAAQVASSARGALGVAGAVLGVTYLVRGIGAVAQNALYWFSPFGWAQGVDAYGDEKWGLLAVVAAAAVVVFVVAAVLIGHRDEGQGLVPPRPGNPRASRRLPSAYGLTLRLQRGLVLGWAVGLGALGLVYAATLPVVPELLSETPEVTQMLGVHSGDQLIEAFLGLVNVILGVIGCVFGVSSVLRLRAEEEAARAETVLATRLTRRRWLGGAVAVTATGLGLVAVVAGLAMVVGYAAVAGTSLAGTLLAGVVAQLPAMLLVAAVAFLLVAWVPRLALLAWVFVAFVAVDMLLGQALGLPDWVRGISPFFHLPRYPAEAWSPVPGAVLLGLTLVLVVAGFVGFRRRDIG